MNHGKKTLKTGVFKFGIVVILTLNIGLISELWAAENEVGTPFELQKSGTISGIDLDYDLHFAPTLVSDDKGQPLANVYSFDYTVSSGDDAARAVTFLFEGGPGGSSAWLHLGFAGPRRFQLAPGTDAPLTGQLEDNRETILRDTDLVIIDPMGTGFTKAVDGVDPAQFWGVVGDGNLIARFVVAWLKNHDRLDNDVFFLGESYGGTRLPAVLHGLKALPETVNLQGVVFISPVIDWAALTVQHGNDFNFLVAIPTYAALARHYGKGGAGFESVKALVAEASRFTLEEYAPALLFGNTPPAERRVRVLWRLEELTGIDGAIWAANNLRLEGIEYMWELLRDDGLLLGRWDGRINAENADFPEGNPDADPSVNAFFPIVSQLTEQYLRGDLGIAEDMPYEFFNFDAYEAWDFSTPEVSFENQPRYVNVMPYLEEAMTDYPDLRIFSASGYFDLATPILSVQNVFWRSSIPADRVEFQEYPGGHLIYVDAENNTRLSRDIRAFISK